MTKANALILAAATVASALLPATQTNAEEVYFDTISTARAGRMQGSYVGIYGGGAVGGDADLKNKLKGQDVDDNKGWVLGAKLGYFFDTPFPVRPAIELEALYLNSNFEASGDGVHSSGDLWALGAFVNGVLSLDLSAYEDQIGTDWPRLRPYVGAGIGGAYGELKSIQVETEGSKAKNIAGDAEFTFAYQFFGGLEVALADDFSLYGEYKYLNLGSIGGENVDDWTNHVLSVGMKVQY